MSDLHPASRGRKPFFRNFPYFVLWRAIWHYAGVYRWRYAGGLALVTLGTIVTLFEPYIMGQLFNVIQKGLDSRENLHQALVFVFLYFLLTPLGWVLHGPGRMFERQGAHIARQNFVQAMYSKLQMIPYAWHQNFHSGQLFDRIRKAEAALEDTGSNQFRYIQLVLGFIGPAFALTLLFPWFGLACLGFVVVAGFVMLRFDAHLVPLYAQVNKLSHDYAGVFSDYMANIRTIITLRLGGETEGELLHRYQARQPLRWREFRLNEWKWVTVDMMAIFLTTSLIAFAVYNVHLGGGIVKIGNLVMLISYLARISGSFFSLGSLYQDLVKAATDYQSTQIITDAYDLHLAGRSVAPELPPHLQWLEIAVTDLSFAYADAQSRPHAIKNISFEIRRGEKIALVGSSGSGKSTLMTLLRGLYRADGGVIAIDGETYGPDALAALTTLIPQDPEIFENTIRYNITFGVEHSAEEIMESCRIAAFDTVLMQLERGLDSDIREKGVNLSGGQKQRLALARGVFAIQHSSLILLDEPTSSVDTLTEMKIFTQLFGEFSGKAVIASIHRLHLLPRFDKIIVMEDGKIIEQGSFQDLLHSGNHLAKIWAQYQEEQDSDDRSH